MIMKVLVNLSGKSFTLDGVPHTKRYEMRLGISGKVSVVSIYDRADVLMNEVSFEDISIGGETFGSVEELMLAFEDLKANFNTGEATPIKQFYGLITQFGTDDPIVTEVINTLGYPIAFTRFGIGKYETTNAFNPDETVYGFNPRNDVARDSNLIIDDDQLDNTGKIQFYSNSNADDYLYRTPFYIIIK